MGISDDLAKPFKPAYIASPELASGRHQSQAGITAALMMAIDVLAVLCALCLASLIRFNAVTLGSHPAWRGAALPLRPAYLLVFIVALLLISYRGGLYGSLQARSLWHQMRWTIQACFAAGLLLCGGMYLMNEAIAPRLLVGYFLGLTTLFLCILRCRWRYSLHQRFKRDLDARNVGTVGARHMTLRRRSEHPVTHLLKRGCESAIASLLLLLLLPTLLVITLCIKLNSPGPVLDASERVGKKGRIFSCFKFRTTTATSPKSSPSDHNERDCIPFTIKGAPQVTAVGRLLRKYSLDELPQLLNVLRGDMSLVGPRPQMAGEVRAPAEVRAL